MDSSSIIFLEADITPWETRHGGDATRRGEAGLGARGGNASAKRALSGPRDHALPAAGAASAGDARAAGRGGGGRRGRCPRVPGGAAGRLLRRRGTRRWLLGP